MNKKTKKVLTQQEIVDRIFYLCNGLSSQNMVLLMADLYRGLRNSEKIKLLENLNLLEKEP